MAFLGVSAILVLTNAKFVGRKISGRKIYQHFYRSLKHAFGCKGGYVKQTFELRGHFVTGKIEPNIADENKLF